MKKDRPYIVSFIGWIGVIGVIMTFLSLFPDLLANVHIYSTYAPGFSDFVVRLGTAILLLAMSIGFLQLKKWGYWLTVFSSVYCLILFLLFRQTSYVNPINNMLLLIFTIPTYRYFGIGMKTCEGQHGDLKEQS